LNILISFCYPTYNLHPFEPLTCNWELLPLFFTFAYYSLKFLLFLSTDQPASSLCLSQSLVYCLLPLLLSLKYPFSLSTYYAIPLWDLVNLWQLEHCHDNLSLYSHVYSYNNTSIKTRQHVLKECKILLFLSFFLFLFFSLFLYK